jgi:hypothetical protein
MDEVFTRDCIRVVLNVGSRNRALENVGWRTRADENVRCGTVCRTVLVPRYPEYVVALCGIFLCGRLFGICAPAASANAMLPMQIKRLCFINFPLFNFVNQTPAIGRSCDPAAHDRDVFRSDVYMNGGQSSVSGIFELKIDNASSKDLVGTAKTSSPQRVRPVADAGEKETKLDAAFHAMLKLIWSSRVRSRNVKCTAREWSRRVRAT